MHTPRTPEMWRPHRKLAEWLQKRTFSAKDLPYSCTVTQETNIKTIEKIEDSEDEAVAYAVKMIQFDRFKTVSFVKELAVKVSHCHANLPCVDMSSQ